MPLLPPQAANLPAISRSAVASERLIGLPAELTVAQCIVESNYCLNAPGNNAFGIKWYPGAFGSQLLHTREFLSDSAMASFLARGEGRTAVLESPNAVPDSFGRRTYICQDLFATFASLEDCFNFHAKLITTGSVYKPAWSKYLADGDLTALIHGVAAKYATAANYADTLLAVLAGTQVQKALEDARAGI